MRRTALINFQYGPNVILSVTSAGRKFRIFKVASIINAWTISLTVQVFIPQQTWRCGCYKCKLGPPLNQPLSPSIIQSSHPPIHSSITSHSWHHIQLIHSSIYPFHHFIHSSIHSFIHPSVHSIRIQPFRDMKPVSNPVIQSASQPVIKHVCH